MNSKILKLMGIICLGFVVSTYNACSSPYSSNSGASADARIAASEKAFGENLHGVLVNQCSQCHGTFQNPLFAVSDDIKGSHAAIMSNTLVDLQRPSASYFLVKLAEGHNGFQSDVIDQVTAGIQAWAGAMNDYDILNPPPDPGTSVNFKVANDSSVLNKAKFIVSGAALTDQDIEAYNNAGDKQQALKQLVDNWSSTPEGQAKLSFYLRNALNQDLLDSEELFRDGNVTELHGSMRQSFARTALDIINNNRPFTQIATTNRFAVNTALLVGYAYMDRSEENRDNRIRRHVRDNLDDPDFNDWRFVTFNQSDNNNQFQSYENVGFWRGVTNNVTFRIPRVGYFSTLAFQANYPTNGDNQFRVTINQALIGGLSRTFSPSDPTPQPNMVHMDDEHSERGSECFQCHRLMDPMRNVFRNKLNTRYRYDSEFSGDLSSFALFNYTNPMSELSDLGESIAAHPKFAVAWTQKLCVAFNTTKCLETDPEFIRVANAFRDSSYNFNTLYQELAASSLVTGGATSQTSLTSGFFVNRVRRTHFCQNANSRIRQIQQSRRVTVDAYDQGSDLCNNGRIRDAVTSLGDDHTVRGLTEVVNSFPVDTFARQSIERACYGLADIIMRRGSAVLSNNEGDSTETLDLITEHLLGIPRSHPRNSQMRQVVDIVYNHTRNDLEMNYGDSIRQVITFACTSPDFIGVGL